MRWWDENVSKNKGTRTDLNSELSFSKDDAEGLTGISQQQVSRWRKKLKDREKYQAELLGAIYKKAMIEEGQVAVADAAISNNIIINGFCINNNAQLRQCCRYKQQHAMRF